MANCWFPPHSASAPFSSRFTPGDSPLPDPPDPPDPNDPFPPLGSVSPKPSRSFPRTTKSSRPGSNSPALKTVAATNSTGIPLDLRHEEGLSLVAGLVGEPKETDDFTKNMVSLTLSHVKVAVDLTKPLPKVVEFIRQSGEVVEVQVSYPWVPATCSHCKELGHVSQPPGLPISPPDSFYAPSLKRSRQDSPPKIFPSFSAQLSFFSSTAPSHTKILALPPIETSNPNPFSVLSAMDSLHHEETFD
ncbi:proline-rich protein 36-like [Raphanus sativus]|nr:proline-rich protein 36-like [Raphanus sativus]